MASSIRVDEDFTLEVIEEVEDEENIIKSEPEWDIDVKLKEEIDFEHNYVDLNQFVNLETIKTEIKGEPVCSEKRVEKFVRNNVSDEDNAKQRKENFTSPRITLSLQKKRSSKLTIHLNLNLGKRNKNLGSILLKKPQTLQKFNKNSYSQKKSFQRHKFSKFRFYRSRPHYKRFNNHRPINTNTYNHEVNSFEQTYNTVLSILNQILGVNQNVQQFNNNSLSLCNYNNYNSCGYSNVVMQSQMWPQMDLVDASKQLLYTQILALLNQLNNNIVQNLLNNLILNILGFF